VISVSSVLSVVNLVDKMPDPPTITRITGTQRDPLRVTVRAGGKVVATLPRETANELGLAVGIKWTAALAARVADATDYDKALRYALRALGRRALSRGELADRIRRRGHGQAVVDQVIEHIVARGWLDDAQYGRAVIANERARKPTGDRLLRHKLAQKRVPRELAEQLVDEAEQDHDAVAEARRFAQTKLKSASFAKLDALTRKRRLWGQLARRGFGPDVIRQALEPLLGEIEDSN